jgi:hypothetical protein
MPLALEPATIIETRRGALVDGVLMQTVRNPGAGRLEADLTLSLPADALITGFSMTMEGQLVAAELRPAAAAETRYRQIVAEILDPGLVEYVAPGRVRIRMFPVMPDGAIRVRIEWRRLGDDAVTAGLAPTHGQASQATVLQRDRPAPADEADLVAAHTEMLDLLGTGGRDATATALRHGYLAPGMSFLALPETIPFEASAGQVTMVTVNGQQVFMAQQGSWQIELAQPPVFNGR